MTKKPGKFKSRRAELHAVTNERDAALHRINQLEAENHALEADRHALKAEKHALEIENAHLSLLGPHAAYYLYQRAQMEGGHDRSIC